MEGRRNGVLERTGVVMTEHGTPVAMWYDARDASTGESMSHRDFANIAVGGTVIVRCGERRTLHKVAKVTKTQFAIESGTRFMRSDGGEYGGNVWTRKLASIPSADDIAAVQAEQRQERAVLDARRLRNQIDTALMEITRQHGQDRGPTIEVSNDYLRRALEVLQTKQEELS